MVKVINQGCLVKFNPSLRSKIEEAAVWVNDNLDSMKCKKHLLREELTQSLGMTNDFDDEMLEDDEKFYNQKYHCDPSYNSLDKRIIKTFLSPKIKAGGTAFKTMKFITIKLQSRIRTKRSRGIKKLNQEMIMLVYFVKCLKEICSYGENSISDRCSICNNEDSQILIKTFNKVCK